MQSIVEESAKGTEKATKKERTPHSSFNIAYGSFSMMMRCRIPKDLVNDILQINIYYIIILR